MPVVSGVVFGMAVRCDLFIQTQPKAPSVSCRLMGALARVNWIFERTMPDYSKNQFRKYDAPWRVTAGPERTSAGKRYWSGVSVGWFVLALAIFYWGLHYRLQQYESARMHSAVPMAKMWLGGERGQAINAAAMPNVHAKRPAHAAAPLLLVGLLLVFCIPVVFTQEFFASGLHGFPPVPAACIALFSRPPPVQPSL